MNRSRSFIPHDNMNPALPADAILAQVRQMIQDLVNQLLTIAERMATLVQSLTPVERANPAQNENEFFAAFVHRNDFTGSGHRTTTPGGGFDHQEALGRALRGEYERAERAELLLAELRAQQSKDVNTQERKRPPRPPTKHVAKNDRPAKRLRLERGEGSTFRGKGKAVIASCTICKGPHRARQCESRQGHCFTCGEPGHLQSHCQTNAAAAPHAPPAREVDATKEHPRARVNDLPHHRPTEDDTSEEDPIEDDTEEGDPVEYTPKEEGQYDDPPAQDGRNDPEDEYSDNPGPVIRVFGPGPYNYSADDAQSQNGK